MIDTELRNGIRVINGDIEAPQHDDTFSEMLDNRANAALLRLNSRWLTSVIEHKLYKADPEVEQLLGSITGTLLEAKMNVVGVGYIELGYVGAVADEMKVVATELDSQADAVKTSLVA